jgi:hypothetical protein
VLTTLLSLPCTIVRREASTATEPVAGTDVDDYGNPLPTDPDTDPADNAYELDTVCELQQQDRDEPAAAGELSDTVWLLYLPPGTELDTGDAVDVDGYGRFELVGDPWAVRNPRTGVASHVEATVRRTGPAEVGS